MLQRVALAALSIAVTVGVSTGLPLGLGAAYRGWQDRSHAYPPEEVAAFVAACTRTGGDPAACTCLIERLQRRYPWGRTAGPRRRPPAAAPSRSSGGNSSPPAQGSDAATRSRRPARGATGRALPLLPVLVLLGAAGLLGGAVASYHMRRVGLVGLLRQPWLGPWGPRLEAQLTASAKLLRRHGWWVALVASAFGAARSSLAVAAGAGRFPLGRLLIIQLPAAFLWSGLYAGGGYLLADQWDRVEQAVRLAGAAGAAAAVPGGGAWLAFHRWRRSRSVGHRGMHSSDRLEACPRPGLAPAGSVQVDPPRWTAVRERARDCLVRTPGLALRQPCRVK